TQAVAYGTLAITNNNQSGELHDTAALNGLGNPVQVNDLFNELGSFIVCLIVSHFFSSLLLELEAALAGAFSQGCNTAVEHIAAAVEHDLFDALCLGTLGHNQ